MRRVSGGLRRSLAGAAVAVAATASFVGAAQPASATPNNCTADGDYFWSTEQDMAQSQTEWCRETWIVDPGYGKFLSREDLLRQHAGFYDQQGFTRQFLWYAPQQAVSVPADSGLEWSGCANHDPERHNGECLPVNVNTDPDHTISYDFGGRAVSLSSLSWGDNFIALVCGNFNVPLALDGTGKAPAPVPTIRGMKFEDANHNGVQDAGEGGVAGVTFQLIRTWSYYGDQGTGEVKTTQSEADGSFTFTLDGEGPGTYVVQEDVPAGSISTTGTTSRPINVGPGAGDKEFDVAAFGNRPEHAPVAVAGPPQTLDQSDSAGARVTLDGSGSSDQDGDPLTYTWTGPFGTVTGTNPNPTVEFPPGGPWTATLTVNDGIEDGDTPASTTVTVYPPVTAHGQDINPVEGQPFSGTVGTFTEPDPAGIADDYTATIDWGDGTPVSAGSITKGADGTFTVNGEHSYVEDGPRAATVTVTDKDVPFNTGTAPFTATVADAALTATGADFLSTNPVNQAVATFTDANPGGPQSDFTASIDWGDGTPATTGTVTGPTGGPFTVSGQHAYQELGPKTITVTIVDEGGQTATATTHALLYAPSGFVIGDQNDAVGTHVTYWGAQWWKDNGLSGGPAPAAFKGYENSPGASTSLSAWSTDPGNSSQPPASVPSYMAVIVSSSITQNGSVISGDAPHVVIVKTDPGYADDPGHAGTGAVVAALR